MLFIACKWCMPEDFVLRSHRSGTEVDRSPEPVDAEVPSAQHFGAQLCETFEFGAVQKNAALVDLGKIYLQDPLPAV